MSQPIISIKVILFKKPIDSSIEELFIKEIWKNRIFSIRLKLRLKKFELASIEKNFELNNIILIIKTLVIIK